VIESGDQPDLARQQHAVAEHVAGHVADTGGGEGRGLDVDVHLAEMAFDRFPGAAGSDAHLLVVVTGRPPDAKASSSQKSCSWECIGGVGEGRRALVGGNHEIGVVAIMANGVGRRHNASPTMLSVTDRRCADEKLVGVTPGFEHRVAATFGGQFLGIETALGANRHDDGILDLLRLDQAEHLGAVILRPVGPAQAAAGNRAETQMNTLDFRTIDKDLPERSRFGKPLEFLRIKLEGQCRTRRTVGASLEKISS
jgi:hypothetical protein